MKWYFENSFVTDKLLFYSFIISIVVIIIIASIITYKEIKKHENK